MSEKILTEDDLATPATPPQPMEWTWIIQRQMSDGDKALTKWQFGFIATDGAEIRVTFHQTDQADQSHDAVYYVTFFSNRNPLSFTKWDTSLSHEDSLNVWVTITHGILDFMRKAQPKSLVLDDLSNGKLKMVMRSVSLDLIDSLPDYELAQTKKHEYRTFFEIKKKGVPSAFDDQVRGTDQEGQTAGPATGNAPSPADQQPPQALPAQTQPQAEQPQPKVTKAAPAPNNVSDTSAMHPQPTPGAASMQPPPQPQQGQPEVQAQPAKGLTIEVGRDYSVTARAKDGIAVDRYQGRNPADVLRWIMKKGYQSNKMKLVPQALPSLIPGDTTGDKPEAKGEDQSKVMPNAKMEESLQIVGNCIRIPHPLTAPEAASINHIVGAKEVRRMHEGVEFEFVSNRDMEFKRTLIELALKNDLKVQ